MKFGKQTDQSSGKNNILAKVILSYLLIGVVLLSTLSFFLYNSFSGYSMNEIENISQKMALQYYNISDKLFTSIYNYFYSLYYTDYTHTTDFLIFSALYSNEFNEMEKADIRRKLTIEVIANPWIYSIYIYNKKADLVFSNISSATTIENFYDKDIISILNNQRDLTDPFYIPRKTEYSIDGIESKLSTLTILYSNFPSMSIPEYAMVVNIDLQELQNIFITGDKTAQMFITDRNGIVISNTDPLLINTDISNEEYINKILLSTAKEGFFITKIENRNKLVTYIKVDKAIGWNIIRVDDMNDLLINMHTVQRNVLFLTFLFVLVGILIAMYSILGFYAPLDKRIKNLSLSVKNVEPIRRNYLLKQLLEGKISKDEVNESRLLNIDSKAQAFTIVILGFDSFKKLIQNQMSETIEYHKKLFMNNALNSFKNIMTEITSIETYNSNDDHICFILGLNNNIESLKKIENVSYDIINDINKNFDCKLTASISEIIYDINDIGIAYKNALQFLNYKIILGCERVITSNDITDLVFNNYEYPFRKEKQLIDALNLCNKVMVEKLLNEILNIIIKFSYDEIMLSIMQLALSTIRVTESGISIKDLPASLEYSNIFKNIAKFDSLREIHDWFMTMYFGIMDIYDLKRDTRKDIVVEKIEKYIDENYSNPNLSIDLLADLVSLSTNYLRIIYKDKTKRSLSNYIAKIRLDKAKLLLIDTNTPINKIPEMVGFQSRIYFYKNFKKNTGKTPDQYRKENRLVR